jgi:hypothetical protein
MAKDGWRERLTNADWKNWQAAYDRWADRAAAEWAEHPNNRSLAQKMYGQSKIFNSNHQERQHVSPLGGVAIANAPWRSSKEKRR